MKKLVMAALTVLAILSLTPGPCAAWDDDSYSVNRPREHWFRGPDGRLHRQWNGWAGYGFGNYFATGGHHRRYRRVIRGAR
jgi:hypothetical protein